MSVNRAELERAAAMLATRSNLVELVVHGEPEWAVMIQGELVPIEAGAGLDVDGAIVLSFFLSRAPADCDGYHLHANEVFVQSVPGNIVKGRPCRLRMTFPVEALVPTS